MPVIMMPMMPVDAVLLRMLLTEKCLHLCYVYANGSEMGMQAEWVMIGEPIVKYSTTSYRRSMGECLARGPTSGMRTGVNGRGNTAHSVFY